MDRKPKVSRPAQNRTERPGDVPSKSGGKVGTRLAHGGGESSPKAAAAVRVSVARAKEKPAPQQSPNEKAGSKIAISNPLTQSSFRLAAKIPPRPLPQSVPDMFAAVAGGT